MARFTLPRDLYHGKGSLAALKDLKGKKAFVVVGGGFQLSFGAKFFGGYRRDKAGVRDYENEAQQNLKAQQNLIKDVSFLCGSYDEVELVPNSIIYCDIPYKDTTKYNTSKGFDYDKFYNWCIEKHNEGHKVFISEYYMPEDRFECVWEKEIVNSLAKGSKGNERLFIVK